MKKKILIFAHYFYPDVASTGQILTELSEGLTEYFDITVIAAVPSYGGKINDMYKKRRFYFEKYGDVQVIRVRVSEFNKESKSSRVKNILSYFFNAIGAIFKSGKQDVVFTISQPPILGGILGVIGKVIKRAKLIYNIQDFNPEQIAVVKYSKSDSLIKVLKAVDKFTCRCSQMIVVVGRDMRETFIKRFKNRFHKDVVINNWTNEDKIFPLNENDLKVIEFKKRYELLDKFVFMYSGNLGLYYDLENIIKIMAKFRDHKNIVFAFVGGGTIKNKLIKFVNDNGIENIKFIPYQKKEDLNFSLNAADVQIVSSAKGIKGVSVPSKIYGVLASGKFSLGILEQGSEARHIIEESGSGICIEPGDYDSLIKLIIRILNGEIDIYGMGLKGRAYLEKYLTKDVSIQKYKDLIESLIYGDA